MQEIKEVKTFRYMNVPGIKARKCTAWCALWAEVVGPYFFEDEEDSAETVNGEGYRNILTNFFFPAMEELGSEGMWFQQDGATCHTTGENFQVLQTRFPGRIISEQGTVNRPP